MYELIQVTENCYYIESPAKIGIVKLNENDVILIDSGNDKDAAKKVKKILEINNWCLKSIFNTHSNADHIGGNKYLQTQTNCKIYAPGIENDFTRHTILEPAFLYGGYPPKELMHKFLFAQESDSEYLTDNVLPDGFEIIPLPGHFFDMVGFRTPDNVVFLADCLSNKNTLDKYKISFIYDVESYLATLENLKSMTATLFIPAHAQPSKDICELADCNIKTVNEIADKIVGICTEPICFENILKALFDEYELTLTFEQYALAGSTVKSYLTYLKNKNRIKSVFNDNMLLWCKI
ncbi:MAG: MBL fold metallo-hydrolase [Clostridia bacterium]|nr:MBL fold metallo-hydrolase [Clostridia bacterium]